MILGSVYCPTKDVQRIHSRIREIKAKHNLSPQFEIKWKKVSSQKVDFFLDLIDYFFDSEDLHFRCVVIDKTQLDHAAMNQTHDEWYYKMYFELLSKIFDPEQSYYIYLDVKDTRGSMKVTKLHEVLCNDMYDFERKIIKRVQEVRSEEVAVLQLADLLIGALQFNRRDLHADAKDRLVQRIKDRSGFDFSKSTLVKEPKFNIFHWRGRNDL
jgi:hypothetical protein